MAHRDIQTGLTPQRVTLVKTLLDQVEAELRFAIKLSVTEKQMLSPIGDRRSPFVEKVIVYAQEFPMLMPAIRNVPNLLRIKYDNESLGYLAKRLASITEMVHDTELQISNNLYDYSLVFYNMVGYAAQSDQPGTQAVKDDLKTLFDHSNAPTTDTPTDGGTGGPNDQPIPGNDQGGGITGGPGTGPV